MPAPARALELAESLGAVRRTLDAKAMEPMLCANEGARLANPGSLYELKLDGVRVVADARGAHVRLHYRTSRSATASYPEIARAVAGEVAPDVVVDGEVVAFDEAGRPSFARLGQRIGLDRETDIAVAEMKIPVAYVVFDVLAVGPWDVRGLSLEQRKELLEEIVPEKGIAQRATFVLGDGQGLFDLCKRTGLEGVIAKKLGTPYRSGARSHDWVKIKADRTEDFVVIGYTRGSGGRGHLGALDVATFDGAGGLVARGKVGSGLDERSVARFLKELTPVETCAATGELERAPRGRVFVVPNTVVRVRFTEWTPEGRLRHPVFMGQREDAEPASCTAEPDRGAAPRTSEGATALGRRAAPLRDIPYYEAIAATLAPHLAGRHVHVDGRAVPVKNGADLVAAVAASAHGLVEIAGPTDFVAFDLVAAPVAPIAARLRDILTQVGLTGVPIAAGAAPPPDFPAGSKPPVRVLVPLGTGVPSAAAEALAGLIAGLAASSPSAQTAEIRVADLRAPTRAPYTALPEVPDRPAKVAAPLAWNELEHAYTPEAYTVRTVPDRVRQLGDLAAALRGAKVNLADTVARLEAHVRK